MPDVRLMDPLKAVGLDQVNDLLKLCPDVARLRGRLGKHILVPVFY